MYLGARGRVVQKGIGEPQVFLLTRASWGSLLDWSISNILRKHNLHFHIYADDIQVYSSFDPGNHNSMISALSQMSTCIDEIMSWMIVNRLKLNEEKSEFLVVISDHLKPLLPAVTLRIGIKIIQPSESVHNLGITVPIENN